MRFIDMVFHRYGNPIPLLDGVIKTQRFYDFVNEFISINNEETEEKTWWELLLHKMIDMSFDEFKRYAMRNSVDANTMSDEELVTTIRDSAGIIYDFCPE